MRLAVTSRTATSLHGVAALRMPSGLGAGGSVTARAAPATAMAMVLGAQRT
jgi:hypothetical protein